MNEATRKPDLEAALKKCYRDVEDDPLTRYGADLCLIGSNVGVEDEPRVIKHVQEKADQRTLTVINHRNR